MRGKGGLKLAACAPGFWRDRTRDPRPELTQQEAPWG